MQMLPTFGTIHFQKLLTSHEIARLIHFLKKTGELHLPDHPTAKLNFIDGKLVHAKLNELEGNEAAVAVLRIQDKAVSFTLGPKSQQTTITENLEVILEKASLPEPPTQDLASQKTVPVQSAPPPAPAPPIISTPPQVPAHGQKENANPTTTPAQVPNMPSSKPVPDTLKATHGSPTTTTTPASPQGSQTAKNTGTASGKKPVLRITLKGMSKDFPIIPGKLMTIGRAPENDICIPDGQISSRHATLELNAKGMHLIDLDSLNGIHFGEKTVKELWLKPNDQFTLGEIPVIVTLA